MPLFSHGVSLCPGCGRPQPLGCEACPECRLPLTWIANFPDLEAVLIRQASQPPGISADQAPPVPGSVTMEISLHRDVVTKLGRGPENTYALADPAVDLEHVLIAPWKENSANPGQRFRFFLVDCLSNIGTFVNHRAVAMTELRAGDFVQVGPFAWSFSSVDGRLIPLPPIPGVGMQLTEVHVPGRLGPELQLRIEPGTFVAVTGPSGAGKSTLIKVLTAYDGLPNTGRIMLLEPDRTAWDRSADLDRFRELLGYVSQDSVLHEELNSRQILRTSAELRGHAGSDAAIDAMLLRMEIERSRWASPLGKLSGGQNKRVRTASELMGEPRFLVLDEPDSGLDQRRRQSLMQLLRSLSWQGCTVVLVTHATTDLSEWCDRVIEIQDGAVVNEIGNRSRQTPSPAQAVSPSLRNPAGFISQALILTRREGELSWADLSRRVVLPTAVAVLFSLAVGVAVPGGELALLGFLAVISVLWMSASLSLLAIAGEWDVFDHERQLFLCVPSYLTAKLIVLAGLSFMQTAIFYAALQGIVTWLQRERLHQPGLTFLILLLVGWAGISLGLCLSALAGRRKETATFLLPLVMLAQIVFSIPIAEHGKTQNSVGSAYEEFHVHRCERCHRQPASRWSQDQGWLCDLCRGVKSSDNVSPKVRWAAWASYLTISRPADIALRILAYDDSYGRSQAAGWSWRWASAQIGGWLIGLLAATAACLIAPASRR